MLAKIYSYLHNKRHNNAHTRRLTDKIRTLEKDNAQLEYENDKLLAMFLDIKEKQESIARESRKCAMDKSTTTRETTEQAKHEWLDVMTKKCDDLKQRNGLLSNRVSELQDEILEMGERI